MDQRVYFLRNQQRSFVRQAKKRLNASWKTFARQLKCNPHTLRTWANEKLSLPLKVAKRIQRITGLRLPNKIIIKPPNWHIKKAGYLGGTARFKKYGALGTFEWRSKGGKNSWRKHQRLPGGIELRVIKKIKTSTLLAEYFGILLGDGGISRYQISVTLNKNTDKKYIPFVVNLTKKLFSIQPHISYPKNNNACQIVTSSVKLVQFLISYGLKIGNKVKNQVAVPSWIMKNRAFAQACLRGMVDTDGSFYVDIHKIHGRVYKNPGLMFTNRSLPLLNAVFAILKMNGMRPTRHGFNIALRRAGHINEYFKIIGTHNPKHKEKFLKFIKTKWVKYGEVPKWS